MTTDRRSFLRGLGASGLLLPMLNAQVRAAEPAARRLIIIAVPNGVREGVYWPKATATGFQILPDAGVPAAERYSPLAPLIPHQRDITFMGGIRIQNGRDSNGGKLGGHASLPFLLTGARGVPGPEIHDGVRVSAGFPSVDQFIARELGKTKSFPFPSLVMGLFDAPRRNDRYLSFNGPPLDPQTPNVPTPRSDPRALYAELFAGGPGADPSFKRLLLERKSVLDVVGKELEAFRLRLGSEDRMKVEAHLEGVRSIEKQAAFSETGCGAPAVTLDPTKEYLAMNAASRNIPEIIKAQIDMTVAAMACDATRVATMLWSDSANVGWVFHWLGEEFVKQAGEFSMASANGGLRNHHEIAHRSNEPEFSPLMNRCCQWYVEQLAYLIQRLKDTPDVGGKTLFDNSAVLFINMQRTGGGHQTDNLPWILAGSCGGYFKTGRYLPFISGKSGQDAPQNGVLVALCNAMGVPLTHYGSPDYGGEASLLRS